MYYYTNTGISVWSQQLAVVVGNNGCVCGWFSVTAEQDELPDASVHDTSYQSDDQGLEPSQSLSSHKHQCNSQQQLTSADHDISDDSDDQDLEPPREISRRRLRHHGREQLNMVSADSDTSTDSDDHDLEPPQEICHRRQRHRGSEQLNMVSADRDTRRCRSLSRDRDRPGHSLAWTVSDLDVIDGVQPLPAADSGPADNGVRSSLSLSVDSVNISASSNKRKAVATLPGNEQKSHRMSL